MPDVLLGALLPAAIALVAFCWTAKSTQREHDVLIHGRDQDLDSWVADRQRRLRGELKDVLNRHNKQNTVESGLRINDEQFVVIQALEEYRNEERAAQRFVAQLSAREDFRHRRWRGGWVRRRGHPPALASPAAAAAVIDGWVALVGLGPEQDPRNRSIATTPPLTR